MKKMNNSCLLISVLYLLIIEVNGIVFNLQPMPISSNSTVSLRKMSSNQTLLYGNTSSLNYYFIDIYLGSPPMRQSLIIDTGSSITTVPCKQLCTNCGNHLNNIFQLKDTSQIVECKSKQCASVLSTCSNGNCTFTLSYSEGSSLSGVFIEEDFSFGNNSSLFPIRKIPIGCTTTESSIFYRQLADGIMGLLNNDKSFTSVLYKNRLIERNLFSICMADNGGYLSVGDIETKYHIKDNDKDKYKGIEYIPAIPSGQFQIELNEIRINNKSIEIENNVFTSIDSGTAITYFPMSVYDFIIKEIDVFCVNKTLCAEKRAMNDLGQCYLISDALVSDLIDYMPSITFIFRNKAEYALELKDSFFIKSKSDNITTICLGYSFWPKNEILLGGTWMRNHDIIFDIDGKRVGFTRSNCTRIASTTTINNLDTPSNISNCNNYQSIFSMIYVILLCVIVFLSTAIYYIRKGKRFFCFKKRFNTSVTQMHQVIDEEIEKGIGVHPDLS